MRMDATFQHSTAWKRNISIAVTAGPVVQQRFDMTKYSAFDRRLNKCLSLFFDLVPAGKILVFRKL